MKQSDATLKTKPIIYQNSSKESIRLNKQQLKDHEAYRKIIDKIKPNKKKTIRWSILRPCEYTHCTNVETKRGDFKNCPMCKLFCYCSREYQTKDWDKHKRICCGKSNKR